MSAKSGVSSRGAKFEVGDGDEEELQGAKATTFRAVAARVKFLAQDRPELLCCAKEVCGSMSRPTVGGMKRLKRIVTYLVRRPRTVHDFIYQEMPHQLSVYCDSDWATCKATSRSTSG